jgi:Subtilase family
MAADPTKPILKLNDPGLGERARGGRPRIPFPPGYDQNRQRQQLGPKFTRLAEVYARGEDALVLRDDPEALAPERLVVFELNGPLITFAQALAEVPGLSLVGEDETIFDEEEVEAQQGYYYLVIPDAAALEQLLSLWNRWLDNEPLGEDHRHWKKVFECLRDLRRWGPMDRVSTSDARIIADAAEAAPKDPLRLEFELVFFPANVDADQARAMVGAAVASHGGTIITRARIPEIAFDAVLVDIPAAEALQIAQRLEGSLAYLADVFAIRLQSLIDITETAEAGEQVVLNRPEPTGSPIAAILDAVPLQNHALLAGRIDVDDPDNLEALAVGKRRHGTAIASLIIHGDLLENEPALTRRVFFRPLMYAPDPAFEIEQFPRDRILVDDFVRAVRRLKIGDSQGHATAPDVILINAALGDEARPFFGRMSPWARALDWLAYDLGLLFIVSAGNCTHNIVTTIANAPAFAALSNEDRTVATVAGIKASMITRSLLSPAEAMNAITVGALHHDQINSAPTLGSSHDPLPNGILPTIVSRMGLGFRRSIKPEVLLPGGRLRVTAAPAQEPINLRPSSPTRFAGLKVAGPDLDSSGQASADAWSGATSAAAALASRAGHRIYDALEAAYPQNFMQLTNRERALIVKALLIHRAKVPLEGRSIIENIFGPTNARLHAQRTANINRMFGYGIPDVEETIGCLVNRATLWGAGQIGPDEAREFLLPLPVALSGNTSLRTLTTTLAWFSPVSPGRRAYKSVRLTVEEPRHLATLGVRGRSGQTDRRAAERGTVFHRAWEGATARAFAASDALTIRVARKPDTTDDAPDTIPFAIAVSLECEDNNIPIYDEIRNRLAIQPQAAVPV